MRYSTTAELENIGRVGALAVDSSFAGEDIVKARALSSFWVCTYKKQDGISEHIAEDGFWESWITLWVSQHVAPGAVCIDAGANLGYYTFFLCQHGCKVYSFEANPALIGLLEYSSYLNGASDRVIIINKAVSDKSGESIRLGLTDSIGGTSINNDGKNGLIFVDSFKLDDLLISESKIDFIKLDIAGSEWNAIKGMQNIFLSNPKCICILEFCPVYYSDKGRGFFNFLQENFFVSRILYDGSEEAVSEDFLDENNIDWIMFVIRTKVRTMTNRLLNILKEL